MQIRHQLGEDTGILVVNFHVEMIGILDVRNPAGEAGTFRYHRLEFRRQFF